MKTTLTALDTGVRRDLGPADPAANTRTPGGYPRGVDRRLRLQRRSAVRPGGAAADLGPQPRISSERDPAAWPAVWLSVRDISLFIDRRVSDYDD